MNLSKPKTFNHSLKKIIKKDLCTLALDNTVIYNGIRLRKVNTNRNSEGIMAYFRCPNMKTPSNVENVCNFSGRIKSFPLSLEIEVMREHSALCSFVLKEKDSLKEKESTQLLKKILSQGQGNNIEEPKKQYEIKSSILKQMLQKKRQREFFEEEEEKKLEKRMENSIASISSSFKNSFIKKESAEIKTIRPEYVEKIDLTLEEQVLEKSSNSSDTYKHETKSIYELYFDYVLNV